MSTRTLRAGLTVLLVVALTGVFASAASASSTAAIALDQSGGTTAGATQSLGLDLTFSNSGSDSPNQLQIELPPGLLANAATDGGQCLQTADLSDTTCQVGTGTVTADVLTPLTPIQLPVTFDLVPAPAAGDLAGLAVNYDGTQIGDTADIKVRASGDPDGVGVTIDLTLPDTLVVPIQITNIDSTFDGLRYPATCPSTPAKVLINNNSYSDSTMQTTSAPLAVTGCSNLTYAPKLGVTATKDSTDRDVKLTALVTQAADEAPSGSLTLGFPGSTLAVNLNSIKSLCGNYASGTCTPVGTVTAVSPFYPSPLTGNAYLTGSLAGPTLTLAFPAPFPLTLVGDVNLDTLQTTFKGLPDIPLTSLSLTLNGGAEALFATNCRPSTGSVAASSTDQNGDKTVAASARYTVAGCSSTASSATGGTGATTATYSVAKTPAALKFAPRLSAFKLSGLSSNKPRLSFRLRAASSTAKLRTLTVKAPSGLTFARHRVHGKLKLTGVRVSGAQLKSLALSRGELVIALKRPASNATVTISGALSESHALAARARSRRKTSQSFKVVVVTHATNYKIYTDSASTRINL